MADNQNFPPLLSDIKLDVYYRDMIFHRCVFNLSTEILQRYQQNIIKNNGFPELLSSSFLGTPFNVKEFELFLFTFLGKFLDDDLFKLRMLDALLEFGVIERSKYDELKINYKNDFVAPSAPSGPGAI